MIEIIEVVNKLLPSVHLQLMVMRRWEIGSTPGIISGDWPRISRKLNRESVTVIIFKTKARNLRNLFHRAGERLDQPFYV